MDNMGRDRGRGGDKDQRGTMNRYGNGWRINNTLVEEVSADNNRTGYLVVSYAVRDRNDMTYIELLMLNVNRNTIIINRNGRNIGLNRIRPGMYIDAEFSYAWTRSIPPQAAAYRIRVQSRLQEPEPPSRPRVTTGPVVSVDVRNGFLLTGDRRDPNRRIRFAVTDQTQILDRRGRSISLRSLSPEQLVQVTHADFMTMSIPPQTNAFLIQVL